MPSSFITDKDRNKADNYSKLNRNSNPLTDDLYNRTPPIIYRVTDTFWLFISVNGGMVEYNIKKHGMNYLRRDIY
jgi:hypothetical protein